MSFDYNAWRTEQRLWWKLEGRCSVCGKVVLDVNPRTNDLYTTCPRCRKARRKYPRTKRKAVENHTQA